jgi:glucan phosphoethanolaminetransferase (alkaline phosphatase superfamily)
MKKSMFELSREANEHRERVKNLSFNILFAVVALTMAFSLYGMITEPRFKEPYVFIFGWCSAIALFMAFVKWGER